MEARFRQGSADGEFLLYVSTRSVFRTIVVLLAVPFSIVGAIWFLYFLGYHMSLAVWVGIIALFGLVPMMIGSATGADTMKRLAAPMIGGLVTSFIMELLIYPVIFYFHKHGEVKRLMASEQAEG